MLMIIECTSSSMDVTMAGDWEGFVVLRIFEKVLAPIQRASPLCANWLWREDSAHERRKPRGEVSRQIERLLHTSRVWSSHPNLDSNAGPTHAPHPWPELIDERPNLRPARHAHTRSVTESGVKASDDAAWREA